jgi:hypothetical protein
MSFKPHLSGGCVLNTFFSPWSAAHGATPTSARTSPWPLVGRRTRTPCLGHARAGRRCSAISRAWRCSKNGVETSRSLGRSAVNATLTHRRLTADESGSAARTPVRAGHRPAPRLLPKGRRGSEVKGGPQGRRLRREAPLSLEERPGTLRAANPDARRPSFAPAAWRGTRPRRPGRPVGSRPKLLQVQPPMDLSSPRPDPLLHASRRAACVTRRVHQLILQPGVATLADLAR